ncbi:MAG: DUF1579 family protein [Planctomycetes bacterium]|nr:DUF1579 family protein [Planctomycetota bacterium]MBL7142919.1 DUF1579 family protein [Phycisphaerae bacterium]
MMEKFDFLLGNWNLEYRVSKSAFSEAYTGSGTGTFKRALDDRYVYFDYECTLSSAPQQIGKAHAIFAWDEKAQIYRFWWFENSGAFRQATCNFIDKDTLFLNWHDTLLIQTFKKEIPDKVILKMEHPVARDKFELILEVIFTRK